MSNETPKVAAAGATPSPGARERLESWGEIALYLNCEIRTAQRWEDEGLPVHRLQLQKQGRVYAYKPELDEWRRKRDPRRESSTEDKQEVPGPSPREQYLQAVGSRIKAVSGTLREHAVVVLLSAALIASVYLAWRYLNLAPSQKVLAVLPFVNLSGDQQQEYFSDGFTDEMIAELARLQPSNLGVIARTSVMSYKGTHKGIGEIGHELHADYIVEGSVMRDANRVRIIAQLIQVRNQIHLWADSYERNVEDILSLQRDVAEAIAGQIQVKLTSQEQARLADARKVNIKAYDAYSLGRFHWNKRTPQEIANAVDYFQQAIREDANYAIAYAGLADAYALMGSVPNDGLAPRVAMPLAEANATKALALDNSLAEVHVSLAYAKLSFDWQRAEAEKHFKQALELNPNYTTGHQWYALYLLATGRVNEAVTEIRRAQELDPTSTIIDTAAAHLLNQAGRYDEALEQCRKALDLDHNFALAHYVQGRTYEQKGMLAEAIAEFQKASELSGGSHILMSALGHAYAVSGRRAEAQQLLAQLVSLSKQKYVPAIYMMAICVGLGDNDQAFRWLNQALEDRCDYIIYLQREPGLDSLRADPRFRVLMRQVGLSS